MTYTLEANISNEDMYSARLEIQIINHLRLDI